MKEHSGYSASYCRLAGGATVAAHLARVAARALQEHVTHTDHLCRLNPTILIDPNSKKSDFPLLITPSSPSPYQGNCGNWILCIVCLQTIYTQF